VTESGKSQGGGNLKYIVGGLLLLCGAAVVIFMLKPPAEEPAPEQAPAPPKSAERVNPMAQQELILDEPADAGKPAEEQVAAKEKPKAQSKEARDEWDCDGDLSRESLQAVIDKNRAQVRNCYEKRLKVNNVLQGDLKLKLKIGANGQVAALAVNGSLHDNEVFGCVRSVAQRWSFAPPTEGKCAVVQVPFQFAPKSN
jgi:outer membrane biosynthesis protein TonB